MLLVALAGVLLAAAPAAAVKSPDAPEWHEPFPPHRVADNLYYVGSKGLSSYLVTTSKGHILINASFERTVPMIRSSIEQLGFKFGDVKILLMSHAHFDHAEGTALLRQLTGADVYVMEGDDKVVESGGKGQYFYEHRWKPCPVKRVLEDGDKVTLGDATLVAHRTPGHTRGCTTWTMRTTDGGKPQDVVIVGSPNVNAGFRLVDNKDYPEIATDYAHSFQVWRSLPCDIFLGAHGGYYGMLDKYARLKKGEKNPFIDPQGYKAYIDEKEKAFKTALEEQQKKR